MPYDVRKRGNKYVVVKKGGGRVLGTHPSRAAALKQAAAIYASENRRKK